MLMSEYEIEDALRFTAYAELPVMRKGAEVLSRLKDWTNNNSDGWPYWNKPSKASEKLQTALHDARLEYHRGHDVEDFTEADLKRYLTPIKSFLTRHNIRHEDVL